MIAGAGARLTKIANEACKNGLSGLEFAAGIPGTVGGAVVMNAGAYGGEIKDIIVSAMVYDIDNDKIITLGNGELELSYRNSILQKKNYVLLEACFELERGNIEGFCNLLNEHWELSKKLDAGCTNTCIDQIFNSIDDLIEARMICGAGGGGFLQVVTKKGVTGTMLRERLWEVFEDSGVSVYDCNFYF